MKMDMGRYVLKVFLERVLCSHFEADGLTCVRLNIVSLEYHHKIKK